MGTIIVDAIGTEVIAVVRRSSINSAHNASAKIQKFPRTKPVVAKANVKKVLAKETHIATTETTIVDAIGTEVTAVGTQASSNSYITALNACARIQKNTLVATVHVKTANIKGTHIATMRTIIVDAIGTEVIAVERMDTRTSMNSVHNASAKILHIRDM